MSNVAQSSSSKQRISHKLNNSLGNFTVLGSYLLSCFVTENFSSQGTSQGPGGWVVVVIEVVNVKEVSPHFLRTNAQK